jgi:two-component system sensor histidine kinase QseC
MTSIKKRILAILLATFTTIWVAMMSFTWYNTEHEIEEVFDAQLAQATNVLFGLTLHKITEQDPNDFAFTFLEPGLAHDYEKKLAFQVWKGDRLLLRSSNAPVFLMAKQFGYSDGSINDGLWRFLQRKDDETGLLVVVGEEYSVRQELANTIILQVFWPILIVLPILGFLIVLGVKTGLQPLQKLTNEIIKRSANQLNPVSMENIPSEISPIIIEINQLLKKLKRAIDTERQFTADAAHELRTPLAAIKTQAQVAQRTKDNDVQIHALDKIVEGVDRSSHLVEQLLTLARLDPESMYGEFETIDLSKILEQSIAQVSHIALECEINISLSSDKQIFLKGIGVLFDVLITNLLKNSFIYTPKGGHVDVTIMAKDKVVVVSISDSGVGIPEALRSRIFDRFYRAPGVTQVGSGLGLSIVKRIVDIHSGKITVVDSNSGGATISIEFPNN